MILLERVAKAIFHTHGIAQVQSITRPLGTPLDHSSIPFQISAGNIGQIENLQYQQDRAEDLLKQVAEIDKTIGILRQQYGSAAAERNAATDEQIQAFHQTVAITNELRDKIANFDDFFRPLRNYFYWEPHCFDIPICWALRSLFDALDGIDALTDQLGNVTTSLDKLNAVAAETAGLDPAPDRHPADQSGPDDDELRHHVGDRQSDGRSIGKRDRPGTGLRRRQKRRLLLPATGGVHQLRIPAGPEAVHVARRQGRPHDHHPRRRSRHACRASRTSTRSSAQRKRPSRAPRWRAPTSTSAAPRRPTRTSRTAPNTT